MDIINGQFLLTAFFMIVSILFSLGLFYLHIVGIYNSFKAHFGLGILAIFIGPFGIAIGAIKVFTGKNILLK